MKVVNTEADQEVVGLFLEGLCTEQDYVEYGGTWCSDCETLLSRSRFTLSQKKKPIASRRCSICTMDEPRSSLWKRLLAAFRLCQADFKGMSDCQGAVYCQKQDLRRREVELNPEVLSDWEQGIDTCSNHYSPASSQDLETQNISPNQSPPGFQIYHLPASPKDADLKGSLHLPCLTRSMIPNYEQFPWFRDRWFIQEADEVMKCCVCDFFFPKNEEITDMETLYTKHEKEDNHIQKEKAVLLGAQSAKDLQQHIDMKCYNASMKESRKSVTKLGFLNPPFWRAPS